MKFQVNRTDGKARRGSLELAHGRVETPVWSPDGNTLAFNAFIDDRMDVRLADLTTGEIRSLLTEPTCCPAWIHK